MTWQEATTKVQSFNTVAALTFHANYYVAVAIQVLRGKPLDAKDEFSFNLPSITCQEDWENLLRKTWKDAEECAHLIESLPEKTLWEDFTNQKYGNYYRNLQGTIEHIHYHLGQIVLIKKMLQDGRTD